MTGRDPLVSLVIPAYNAQDYIALAIESVLRQDYPLLDLLVLDDGSTDETLRIVQRYSGRIRWDSHANMGQADTLNKGWAMTQGELVGYLSADDLLLPQAMSRAVRTLQADPGLVLVYPDYLLVDAQGSVLKRVRAPEFDYRDMVVRWVVPPGPGALFRRTAAVAAGPWKADLKLSPDYDFWLRLGLHGRGRRIPEPLACFRVHEASQTFGAVPPDRSEEYVKVTQDYFDSPAVPAELRAARSQALSNAHLFAARSHLRSSRYGTGLMRAAAAVRMCPGNIGWRSGKILGHGLLNHLRVRRPAGAR